MSLLYNLNPTIMEYALLGIIGFFVGLTAVTSIKDIIADRILTKKLQNEKITKKTHSITK